MSKASEIINNCLTQRKISQRKLAERMGIVVQILNQQLKRDDIKLDRFTEILDFLGFRVAIEDIGIVHKVTIEEGNRIKAAKNTRCYVWTEDEGIYQAIACDGSDVECRYFDSKNDCINYLTSLKN